MPTSPERNQTFLTLLKHMIVTETIKKELQTFINRCYRNIFKEEQNGSWSNFQSAFLLFLMRRMLCEEPFILICHLLLNVRL